MRKHIESTDQSKAKQSPGVSDTRPAKPRDDFPLFPHASGRWAKKVRGKLEYFGKWSDDPKGERAINKWLDEKDDLLEGRKPRPKGDAAGPTVKLICDAFLTHKEQQRDNDEIQPRTFDELYNCCVRITAAFGRSRLIADLRPEDFRQLRQQLAKTRSPLSLAVEMQRVRSVFKFAYDDDEIDRPIRFGKGFEKPSRKVLNIERAKRGRRDLQADQVRALIEAASPTMKAMILLGVNCGFGNNDIATLPLSRIDLSGGWVEYARPKTGANRRAKLWPETVAAVQAAIKVRPEPEDAEVAKLVFVTRYGAAWVKSKAGHDSLGVLFRRLLRDLNFHSDGVSFYALRRTFRTIADEVRDAHAINLVMGHSAAANDMGSLYTQHVGDDRLEAVAKHVRTWLFPKKTGKSRKSQKSLTIETALV